MITLDPVQLFALRKSANEPVDVAGLAGAGKSTLANAIATLSVRDGRSCLLIGRDALLDRPIAFQALEHVHQVLADRAQLNNQTNIANPAVRTKMVFPSDFIEARAKADPVAAKTAVRLLRRARELTGRYKLSADEIEESIANQSIAPEAFDLASLPDAHTLVY
jgi:ABC-type sugar transport system ATPase subunit